MGNIKALNLYSGLGGNRQLWENVDITAVEIDDQVAAFYKDRYPSDNVVVGDAHEYLLKYFSRFDFIWSSRPCTTHSRARYWAHCGKNPIYPDLGLYQEIIFLKHHFKGKWVVENVEPYYKPLIPENRKIGRHFIWSNFVIPHMETDDLDIRAGNIPQWEKRLNIDLSGYSFTNRTDQLLRNCVLPEIGLHIFNAARGIIEKSDTKQLTLI